MQCITLLSQGGSCFWQGGHTFLSLSSLSFATEGQLQSKRTEGRTEKRTGNPTRTIEAKLKSKTKKRTKHKRKQQKQVKSQTERSGPRGPDSSKARVQAHKWSFGDYEWTMCPLRWLVTQLPMQAAGLQIKLRIRIHDGIFFQSSAFGFTTASSCRTLSPPLHSISFGCD